MAEPKTKATDHSVEEFLNSIEPQEKREDGLVLLDMFKRITGEKAVMWGPSIVGFGVYHYKSERSRQEGDWPRVGFSPRKQSLTLYIIIPGNNPLFEKLGKHKTSVGCLYINKLADVDLKVLADLIKDAYTYMEKAYPSS